MAERIPRFLWDGLARRSATVLTASSQQPSAPVSYLAHVIRSKAWRSKIGWTFVAGVNDGIPLNESTSGDALATIVAGTYTTGAAVATAMAAALNAAATDNTYSVAYSASTNKFTVTRASGSTAWALEWATGGNAATSVGVDIGFDVSADDTVPGDSKEADEASYQSRHWIKLDLGSAIAAKAWVLSDHNLIASAVVSKQANATDAWTAPTTNSSTWDAAIENGLYEHHEASPITLQFVRLLIDDVQNPAGFNEVGLFFYGGSLETSQALDLGFQETGIPSSTIARSPEGVGYQTRHAEPEALSARMSLLTVTDRDALRAMEQSIGRGGFLFLAQDPQNNPGTKTRYGQLSSRIVFQHQVGGGNPADRFTASFAFMESLG